MSAMEQMVDLLEWCQTTARHSHVDQSLLDYNEAYSTFVIVEEGHMIPPDGIDFDIPKEHLGKMTKSLLQAVRRLHLNCGHPPNADLERVIRLSGGSE